MAFEPSCYFMRRAEESGDCEWAKLDKKKLSLTVQGVDSGALDAVISDLLQPREWVKSLAHLLEKLTYALRAQQACTAQIARAEAAARAAVPPVPAATAGTGFTGDSRAFWRLQLRGSLLLAATLGIYRFWFATDVRRPGVSPAGIALSVSSPVL